MMFEDALRANLPDADEIIARAEQRRRRAAKTAAGGIAAALAIAMAGLFWLDPAYRSEQVATAVGERGSWILSDGSEVQLNTGSRLRVEYHLRSRRLYLPQGEALFKPAGVGDTSVNALVDLDGVLDFTTPLALQFENARGSQSAAALWLGGSWEQAPGLWREADLRWRLTRRQV